MERNPRGNWVQKIGYSLAVNKEEDGKRVTGTSGILFLERGRPKQTGFVRKKSRKKRERARKARKVAVTWFRRWLWRSEVMRGEEQTKL